MHAVSQTVTVLHSPVTESRSLVQVAPGLARAKHSRVVKMTRIWRERWREPALSMVLALQLLVLFVMPAARTAGLPLPHFVVRGLLCFFVMLALLLARNRSAMAVVIVAV